MRFQLLFLTLLPYSVLAEDCGLPEYYSSAFGSIMEFVADRAFDLDKLATESGAIAIRWSLAPLCIEASQSADMFAYDKVMDECFKLVISEATGVEALGIADSLQVELPDSIVVVGWAVSDKPNEYGFPKIFSRLSVPGYPMVVFDQSSKEDISCLDVSSTSFVE